LKKLLGIDTPHNRDGHAADEHTDRGAQEKQEAKDAPIDAHLIHARQFGSRQSRQPPRAPPRDCQPDDPAEQGQHDALRQKLPHQPERSGAKRHARGDLPSTDRHPHEPQVGDVHHRKQQDDRDRSE